MRTLRCSGILRLMRHPRRPSRARPSVDDHGLPAEASHPGATDSGPASSRSTSDSSASPTLGSETVHTSPLADRSADAASGTAEGTVNERHGCEFGQNRPGYRPGARHRKRTGQRCGCWRCSSAHRSAVGSLSSTVGGTVLWCVGVWKLPWPDVCAGRESNALRRFVFTEEVAQILRTACDYVSSITTFLPG